LHILFEGHHLHIPPVVVVKWLTLLLHIWRVLDSNLGPVISQPEVFIVLLSPPSKCWDNALNLVVAISFDFLFNSSFTCHSFIRHYVARVTEKASLSKLQISKFTYPALKVTESIHGIFLPQKRILSPHWISHTFHTRTLLVLRYQNYSAIGTCRLSEAVALVVLNIWHVVLCILMCSGVKE
jgi:hypothetical protein